MFKFTERHGFVYVKFRLAARRSHGGRPERKQVSAALEQAVGRIEHGCALGRPRTFLLDLFYLHPQRGKPAAVLRERGHRRAQAVLGRHQAVVLVRADFLRVGRRFVVKVLHAREHRLVLVSVRSPIDEKRERRHMQRLRRFVAVLGHFGLNLCEHDQGIVRLIRHEVATNPPSAPVCICRCCFCHNSAVRMYLTAHLRLRPVERAHFAGLVHVNERLLRQVLHRLAARDEPERADAVGIVAQLPFLALEDERRRGGNHERRNLLRRVAPERLAPVHREVLHRERLVAAGRRVEAEVAGPLQVEGDGPPRREARVGRFPHGIQATRHLLRIGPVCRGKEELPAIVARRWRTLHCERHAPGFCGNGRDFDRRAEEPRVFAVDRERKPLVG